MTVIVFPVYNDWNLLHFSYRINRPSEVNDPMMFVFVCIDDSSIASYED